MRRWSIGLLAIFVVGLIVTACGGEESAPTAGNAARDPVTADLGVVLTLTGPSSVFGSGTKAGMELALEEINAGNAVPGVRINATFEDDAGSAASGAQLFQSLIDDGVDVLAGPTLSNTALQSDPVAQQASVPVIAVSNTAQGITEIGDYIFRVSLAEADVLPQTVAAVANEFAPKTAALLYGSDDAWSRSSAESMRSAAAANNIEIITEQSFPSNTTDVRHALEAVGQANPDIILLAALEAPSIVVVKQARELGLTQRFVCGNGCNTGTFISSAGPAAEGLIVGAAWNIEHDNAMSQQFVERYQAKYGSDPDQFAAQGYTGVYVLAKALETSGAADRDSIRQGLSTIAGLDTVLGPFSFNQQRNAVQEAIVQIVENGRFTILN